MVPRWAARAQPLSESLFARPEQVAYDTCVLRFDNERGKGDHKHVGDAEMAYTFRDLETLIQDFYAEVARWMKE